MKCKNPTCTTVLKRSKTGFCSPCFLATVPKKERICTDCPKSITRFAKTGRCEDCAKQHKASDVALSEDSVTETGDSRIVTRRVEKIISSLPELIDQCQIDTDMWKVERWICNSWPTISKHPITGDVTKTQAIQVKAWLVRNVIVRDVKAELSLLIADAKTKLALVPGRVKGYGPSVQTPYVLELHIPDVHVGKLAWSKETGDENYDSHIAVDLFQQAVTELLDRTSGHTYNKILLVVGNDALHSDTKQGTTTAGTQLDTDSRYHKSFVAARRMYTWAIHEALKRAPVHVPVVSGNHASLSEWHLGDSLECLFDGKKFITIDNDPSMRKYLAWAKNMVMWTHGNRGKLANYPQVMAKEHPEMWGPSRNREAHTGDKHHTKVQDFFGTIVRISPALCAPDFWHSEHQFIGSKRAAEAFTWHDEEGVVAVTTYQVLPDEARTA